MYLAVEMKDMQKRKLLILLVVVQLMAYGEFLIDYVTFNKYAL